ncbi:MAG: hypothetical protein WCX90_09020, partial [Thiohalomonadaceae bacterium]
HSAQCPLVIAPYLTVPNLTKGGHEFPPLTICFFRHMLGHITASQNQLQASVKTLSWCLKSLKPHTIYGVIFPSDCISQRSLFSIPTAI